MLTLMHMVNNGKELLSTTEVASLLGISRVAVFKKIKTGELPAQKVGRNYVIERRHVQPLAGHALSRAEKAEIARVVGKAVAEYREAFDLLGRE